MVCAVVDALSDSSLWERISDLRCPSQMSGFRGRACLVSGCETVRVVWAWWYKTKWSVYIKVSRKVTSAGLSELPFHPHRGAMCSKRGRIRCFSVEKGKAGV